MSLDQDYSKKTHEQSNKIYNDIMNESNDKANTINADYQSRINYMDNIYKKYKDDVVNKIVGYLIDDNSN